MTLRDRKQSVAPGDEGRSWGGGSRTGGRNCKRNSLWANGYVCYPNCGKVSCPNTKLYTLNIQCSQLKGHSDYDIENTLKSVMEKQVFLNILRLFG